MNTFKKMFVKGYRIVKFITISALMGLCFYTGMYIVSFQEDPNQTGKVMVSKIKQAMNQGNNPIIVIMPKLTLAEKVKIKLHMNMPEREIITITTAAATKNLGIKHEDPTYITSALNTNEVWSTTINFWKDTGIASWDWIKQTGNKSWKWTAEKMPFVD